MTKKSLEEQTAKLLARISESRRKAAVRYADRAFGQFAFEELKSNGVMTRERALDFWEQTAAAARPHEEIKLTAEEIIRRLRQE